MVALPRLLASTAALDVVDLWNEGFSDNAKVIRDGAVIGNTATDLNATGGTNVALRKW